MKNFIRVGTRFFAILLLFNSCDQGKLKIDPAFKAYVSEFTSGTIQSLGAIHIRLTSDAIGQEKINSSPPAELFSFSPEIPGNAVWIDQRTIEFRPSKKMQAGKEYRATFQLSKVLKVPEAFSNFNFNFRIIEQSFEVSSRGLHPADKKNFNRQFLTGSLITADIAENSDVEKILMASQNGKALPIRWIHENLTHGFTVDSILRSADSSYVILIWNGNSIGVNLEGSETIAVPALGEFKFMGYELVQQETDQHILLQFSDPLEETQNLSGLINLGSISDLRFLIESNTVRVYPPSRQTSELTLTIDPSIKNTLGKTLLPANARTIKFEEIKPALRLNSRSVILPGSTGLMFPFEAVNLSAVDVKVVKIFAGNVTQFLQVNSLDGNHEITRVGKIVLHKTIPLTSLKKSDLKTWNQYAIDLKSLVKIEQGSIYQVTIGFRKKHSIYLCEDSDTTTEEDALELAWDDREQSENSYWDYVEDYYYSYQNYDWRNRDNPCKREYYTPNRFISRNVLASNLGIIAKRGTDGSMAFTITDIRSTNPLAGVSIAVYNFQKQVIADITTNANGMAQVVLKDKPFMMMAKKGDETGYMRLDDGMSLSLSMFDVAGEKVQNGIKGFMYAERGVWRPGDSLYITFLLEDKQHSLPANHPVQFELFNPMGQLSERMIRTESVNGFYSFHTKTDEEAPTGNWQAKVKVGGATFNKTIRIETIMPNRLKIKFEFPKEYIAEDENILAKLEAKWLTGATARSLKSIVESNLTETQTAFPRFENYTFDDPVKKFTAEKQEIFNDKLSETGMASVPVNMSVEESAPGMLQANFVTRVFEPGGAFSIDRFSIPYHPYPAYVGIKMPLGDRARGMLLTDTNHIVKIACVDRDGKLIKGNRKVTIEFYKVRWKWWWDRSEENLTDYNSREWQHTISTDTIELVNGEGSWTLRVNYPEWGRYMVRVKDPVSGHSSGKTFYIDWPGWAGRGQRGQQGEGITMLNFSAGKEKYTVGEEAIITVPTSSNSRSLISIENGTKVLQSDWLIASGTETHYKFRITPEMTPNIFIHVTLLQPHAQVENDLPIRLYGVIPVLVENPGTHLTPVLTLPQVLKPEEKFKLTVKEAKGKSMTYTIAMVDEGLLDLTRFRTPDPWNAFYGREALGVKTWDMFDNVLGAWSAKLERILSIGGDEGLTKPKDARKANRFKPVVKFLGPYHLKKGATDFHEIEMPQYVGSVRFMIIGAEEGAYGFAEKAVPVRKPLMVLATLPRILGPGETTELPVSVFALENHVKDVKVEIFPSDIFISEKESSKTVHFKQTGDELVNFRLKTKETTGTGKVKVVVTSGNERAITEIELNVINRNPKVVNVIDTVLDTDQSWTYAYKPVGVSGTNRVTLETSKMLPINLGRRLEYLIQYPYGCIEQTTSSVFPQLYLSDLMDMTKSQKAVAEKNIIAGIDRLKLFQLPSGGISYWPGENYENDYATNYAGHFLIEAERKGFAVSSGYMEQWKRYQKRRSNEWTNNGFESQLTQAYRLYTLALIKSPDLAGMNRMREMKDLQPVVLWSLAATYQLVGQSEVAAKLIEGLPIFVSDYKELSGTFGSDERDGAIILETFSLLGRKTEASQIAKRLSESLCSQEWMSTHTTAMILLSMSKYIGRLNASTEMNFTCQLLNSPQQNVQTTSAIKQIKQEVAGISMGGIRVKNNGAGLLFVRIISEGIPATDDRSASQNNLELAVSYKTSDGKDLIPAFIKQGTDFYAEVTVKNPGTRRNYSELALNQLFPSGWEIMNSRLDQMGNPSGISTAKYIDIRDDRVYTFFDLQAGATKKFRVYLNASYIGRYYLPTIYCEAMYDASINARIPGQWVTVTSEEKSQKELSKK